MNTKPNLKAIIDNNLDKTGHIPSKGQSRLPKEGWLDSYKHGGPYASSWMLTNPKPAPVSFPRMQFAGPVSSQDSLRHQAGKMFNFEGTKGSPTGTGLANWGYHQSQMPWNTTPKNWKQPKTKEEAVDLYMQEIATNPILTHFPSAMEKGEAGDFLYNTGRDARVYMLDQYLKSKGEAGLPNRGSYNVDTKTEKWTPELQQSLNEQWNNYSQEINKLPTNTRRQLLNKGRDFYYQNTSPIGYKGPMPHPSYEATWKPRIWESVNTYENGGDISIPDLDADKWLMKYQVGGQDAPLPAIGSKAYYDLQKVNQNRTDAIPSRGNQREQAILQNVGQSKLAAEKAAQEAARVAANREGLSQYNPKPGDAEHRRIMAQKYATEHGGYSDEQGNYHQGLLGDAADSKIANRTWENIVEPGINAEMIMSGAGLVGKGAKSLGKYAGRNIAESMESGLLSNTHKLNPWAFKANPNSAYRMLGDEVGLNDAIQNGYLKPSTKGSDIGMIHDETHFQIGAPSDKRKYYGKLWDRGYPGPYMAEVSNAVKDPRFSPTTTFWGTGKELGDNVITFPQNYIPTSEAKLYKQDWLRGYKEVPKSVPAKKKGGMITDPRGQWAHPGQNTRIPSNNITMEGVGYPVLAKASNGQQQMMYPGQNYYFPGASHVDEYPMMESGGWLNKHL